jgi:hypothetical protein
MAPYTPRRSERPGGPVALLDHPRLEYARAHPSRQTSWKRAKLKMDWCGTMFFTCGHTVK